MFSYHPDKNKNFQLLRKGLFSSPRSPPPPSTPSPLFQINFGKDKHRKPQHIDLAVKRVWISALMKSKYGPWFIKKIDGTVSRLLSKAVIQCIVPHFKMD